jgi:hypothetical protein
MTHKEAIAAFYRELTEGKEGTADYVRQAMARLGTILQQFRMDNESFPGPVQDPWEFFSYYAELNWFPRHKKMLKRLSDSMLIGKIDMEFKAFLKAEQKKTRPVIDPKKMSKPEPKPRPQKETEPFGVDIPPNPEHKAHRDKYGNWTLNGQRTDHQHTKTILDFRKPIQDEVASSLHDQKELMRKFQPLIRRLEKEGDEILVACIKAREKHEIDRQNDPELRQEDMWQLMDAINKAIEKARQDKALKKK